MHLSQPRLLTSRPLPKARDQCLCIGPDYGAEFGNNAVGEFDPQEADKGFNELLTSRSNDW